jgi:CHAT domain
LHARDTSSDNDGSIWSISGQIGIEPSGVTGRSGPSREPPMPLLVLVADEVKGPWNWFWRLKDDRGTLLAHHEVVLDPADWQAQAFTDLYRYVRRHADPGRWTQSTNELLGKVGAWAGQHVLGAVGPAIIKQGTPVTVRVELPADQALAEGLQYLPLELAHVGGKPLALQDVSLVIEVRTTSRDKEPTGKRLRMLAVFSLPTGTSALNLRQERYQLKETIRSIARTAGRAIHLRVLQYGVTRKVLKTILEEGEGWDLVHFSGHGLASQLVLEKADGTQDTVDVPALIELLKPARGRLKWVTLSACWSGAATVAETLRWLGLEPHRDDRDLGNEEPSTGSKPAAERDEEGGKDKPKLTSVASALVRELDCAVLAMRYPVDDEFATALANTVYRGVLEQDQSLTRALQLALPETIAGQSLLCAATPVLFGHRAADLTLDVPKTHLDELDVPTVGGLTGFPPQPAHFVGRVGVMAKAGAALAPRSSQTGVLFYGMSGAGKSACAIELAYQYEDVKRFTGFVWYLAPTEGSEVAGSLAAFATAFETQLSGETFEAPFPLVALLTAEDARFDAFLPRLRDFLTKRSVLLVLDNLETLLRPDGGWIDPRWGKVVATLLAHGGDSRVVLTSRVVPALAPPPGPPVAGDFVARLLKLPIHALGRDEAALLARQLKNLGTLLKGRDGAAADTREADRQLVVRTLNLVQGHPKLIELAEAQAADTKSLACHLERAENAWTAQGVGSGELASFFSTGASCVGADAFLRALAGWTDAVAATLPEAARTLFQVLCCYENEDRESRVIEPTWPNIWKRLSLPGNPSDLAATLAPLVQMGLVDDRPAVAGEGTQASVNRHFVIHPGVTEAGRTAAAAGLQAAVDTELADFWRGGFHAGCDRESEGGSSLVVLAGRRAAPYLLRRQEWDLAGTLLEGVIQRDTSPVTVAAVLPMLVRIAEVTKGTDWELIYAGVLARALWVAGRGDEAEVRMREIAARATKCGQYSAASAVSGYLIDLLRDAGRAEEALDLVDTKKEASRRAGLGPWTQLLDDVLRLQLLISLGRYDEVLAKVEALRPRMDALSPIRTREDTVFPWNVRETLLDTGRLAARLLKLWELALALNAEVIASMKARRATALDVVGARFNDYKPLLGLGRLKEAHALLMKCREVVESKGHLPGLGKVFGALADLEDMLGHRDRALRHGQTALRYAYAVGEPGDCAVRHFNLANYLTRGGGPPAGSLAHRLACALIEYQSADGGLTMTLQVLSRHFAFVTPGESPLPGDFAALCVTVDQVEGVDFAVLFQRLPMTRTRTGDDALRKVLELARQQPTPALPPLLAQLQAAGQAGQDPEPIWQAIRAQVVQDYPGEEVAIDAYIAAFRAQFTRAADADAEPVPPPPST